MRFRYIVAFVLALSLGGCAGQRHAAVVVDAALYEALNDIHIVEQTALCGQPSCAGVTARVTPTWTDAKSQNFNQKLLPAVVAGREFNAVLGSWDPGTPVPPQLHNVITGLTQSLTAITGEFPAGTTKEKILENIAKAQSIALTALDLVLTLRGGGQ